MTSFGGLHSGGSHSHHYTSTLEFDEGTDVVDVKQEPLTIGSADGGLGQQLDQYHLQQSSMMDALSSNPMLTTASMPIPSRNTGTGHQRAMVGVVSDLDYASEMMDHQFRAGQLHDTVTIENGTLVGSGGGVVGFPMNGGGGLVGAVGGGAGGGAGTGSLPAQIDTLYAIPNGWDSMVLTSEGIDFGAVNMPGLQMMDTWTYVSPSSTASSVTPNDGGQLQDTTAPLTMVTPAGAMMAGGQVAVSQQIMDEFYPLDEFSDGLLCNDLNTIEGLFHEDITLLSQPIHQQSPNLSGDSGIMPSSLPQQLLGRSGGGGGHLHAGGLALASENTVGSVGSNSVSSFGTTDGSGIQLLLSSDPMVAASYLNAGSNSNSNSNILLYDEQTRISSSPFEVYTKQEPGSAVPSPLAFSPSSHGSSPSISEGHLMVPLQQVGAKTLLQQQLLQSSINNNNNNNNNNLYNSSPSTTPTPTSGASAGINAGQLIKSSVSPSSNSNSSSSNNASTMGSNKLESSRNQNNLRSNGNGIETNQSQQMPQRAARRGLNFSRNSGNVGQVQHNPRYSTLQQLLMNNTNERLIGASHLLGQSVPSGSGLLSPGGGGGYSGRRMLQGHHSAAAAAAGAAGAVSVGSSAGTSGTSSMSRLSSSAPTHISGFEQIWQRREPRPHLLSTGSLAEATGSTSSLSTGSVLSPEGPDFSHDEGYSDDSDHYEDYSSGEDSDSEDTGKVSTSAGSKAKRYFWQYNVQAKGPKGQRLVIKTQAEDPHVLNAVTDPVFSPHCSVRGIKNLRLQHSGKARKGDGNDLTPNPRKLHNIGKELDKLGRVINDMKPVSELPFNARPKTRKEKNKLASRACRLKKKAQHEANKIKLYGLETEHRRLMNGIFQLKQILVTKCNNAGTGTPTEQPEEYKQQLDSLVQTSSKIKIAGNSTEFVNKMLENVRTGNNTSIDTVLEHF